MELCPLLDDRSDAVNFDERLAGKSGDGDGCTRGAAVWKIRFENGVHAVVIVELCKKYGELKDAVHRAAARLDGSFDAVHNHLGVHFDGGSFSRVGFIAARVCALSGDVDEAVVNNQRRDETLSVRGLSVAVQFLHAPWRLLSGSRRSSGGSGESEAWQKSGQLCGETATSC